MAQEKKKNSLLKTFAWSAISIGVLLNGLMYIKGAYPTYLFFVLMGFGLILLLIGRVVRQMRPMSQLAIALLPFALYFTFHYINLPSSDLFLIPKEFRGTVYIYYNQSNGARKEYEGSRRLYRIPKDGILLTQFDLKEGIVDLSDSKFYLVDYKNMRVELKHCSIYDKKMDTTMVQAISGECGESANYGTYQTIYIDFPNKKFWKEKDNIKRELSHDSIMKIKTSNSQQP